MTFNIRLATTADGINQWENRKDYAVATIGYYEADICGLQEAFIKQINDISERLPNYGWAGKGRDDGKEAGEFSPIFYNKNRFELIETNTFWLSETPDKVGFGWDAKLNRVCTWVKLKDKQTKKTLFAFNTHFDHQAVTARRESAKLILEKIKEIAGNSPVILTGDFNAQPADEPIRIITRGIGKSHFVSAKQLSSTPHFGPTGTFNGFKEKERDDEPIDFIFVNDKTKVLKHATLSGTWGGRFASDHFAVLATIVL